MAPQKHDVSRRQFLKRSSLALAGAAAAELAIGRAAHAAGGEMEIKIGVVGCGGRGTGAALDALGAATRVIYPASGYHTEDVAQGAEVSHKNIRVVALADLFEDRLARCREQLTKLDINIPDEQCFTGFDGYKQLLAVGEVNYVILATPPHFRPAQLMAAVEAGKHVFIEKPAAVDVPGVKLVMQAGELARQKGLGIAAGTQRRHMNSYQETIGRLHDGAIGEIVYGKCYWNGGEIWVIQRQEGWSDMEWQLRNWNYLTWLSGDHYVEQHVHNLDIMNWVLGTHPVKAVSGIGGRQVRTKEVHGHIFDHFAVEFEYPGGISMFSQARQINGCRNKVEEAVVGTGGTSNCKDAIHPKSGDRWRFRGPEPSPYRQEHETLITSIREGSPINEAQAIAESTMTGILGREAAYSGQEITWDDAMKSTTRLGPEKYQLGPYPMPEVAKPGIYRFG
ncbi:MAG: Gfo/Idh/MocA family oxidoreductase [Thermoguttaceae bacterium]|jgi:predicted dehydrogenase|nr:Gfo/Idh/MocA family oxidoreductase [Thermoguttaceae bacterium]